MPKTIIFDLGGVYFTDGTKKAIIKISAKYDVDEEKVKDALKGKLGTQYRVGALTQEDFWKKAKKLMEIDAPTPDLQAIWVEGYKPIEGTVKIIDRLREEGYELLFLSDNVQERVDFLEARYKFLKKFKDGVFSHLIGTRKPDVKIYKAALAKTSSKAADCIYIDDKPELLAPAKKLGMNVIHFESPAKLKAKLRLMGIKL